MARTARVEPPERGEAVSRIERAQRVERMSRIETGMLGERIAAERLESEGYEILARRWRCRWGEIDLVARRGEVVAFIEVKTRRTARYGHPAEAITPTKCVHLRRAAAMWFREREGPMRARARIDAVAVLLRADGSARIEHLRGVCI